MEEDKKSTEDYTLTMENGGSTNSTKTFRVHSSRANTSFSVKAGVLRAGEIFDGKPLGKDQATITISDADSRLIEDMIEGIETRNANIIRMRETKAYPLISYSHDSETGDLTLASDLIHSIARAIVDSQLDGKSVDSTGDYLPLGMALERDLHRINQLPERAGRGK